VNKICEFGHEPTDVDFQLNGPEVTLTAHCNKCGFGLEFTVEDSDWNVYGDSTHNDDTPPSDSEEK
jgi:hypothetical protein